MYVWNLFWEDLRSRSANIACYLHLLSLSSPCRCQSPAWYIHTLCLVYIWTIKRTWSRSPGQSLWFVERMHNCHDTVLGGRDTLIVGYNNHSIKRKQNNKAARMKQLPAQSSPHCRCDSTGQANGNGCRETPYLHAPRITQDHIQTSRTCFQVSKTW